MEPEPEGSGPSGSGPGRNTLTTGSKNENTWSVLAHLSVFLNPLTGFLGSVGALVIWLMYRDRSPRVSFHALQSLWHQVAWMVLLGVGWALTGLLTLILVGFLLIPVMIVATVVPFVHMGYVAYKVSQEANYRYPCVADLTDGGPQEPDPVGLRRDQDPDGPHCGRCGLLGTVDAKRGCLPYAGMGKRGRAAAPGCGLGTSDGGTWALRRPDGTAVSYFGAWGATREAVERAAREDRARRKGREGPRSARLSSQPRRRDFLRRSHGRSYERIVLAEYRIHSTPTDLR